MLTDCAYDADSVRAAVAQAGAQAVTPSKKNRKVPSPHDTDVYEHRDHIKRCFNRLKAYRGLATRFERMWTRTSLW